MQTSFARTFRSRSDRPNFQNWPVAGEIPTQPLPKRLSVGGRHYRKKRLIKKVLKRTPLVTVVRDGNHWNAKLPEVRLVPGGAFVCNGVHHIHYLKGDFTNGTN